MILLSFLCLLHVAFPNELQLKGGIYELKVYDKRDNYPFFITRMPDLNGIIPVCVLH